MVKLSKFIFNLSKLLLLWEVGGSVYYMMEIIYRGRSHDSMFILGGICLVLVGLLNEIFTYNMYFELQIIIGDIIVLALEFITGCIVNIRLGLGVWDYSNLPGNLLGQICPQFAVIWIPVIFTAIIFDDWIRWKYLREEKPNYRFFIIEKIKAMDK